jgi:hypothetical protein
MKGGLWEGTRALVGFVSLLWVIGGVYRDEAVAPWPTRYKQFLVLVAFACSGIVIGYHPQTGPANLHHTNKIGNVVWHQVWQKSSWWQIAGSGGIDASWSQAFERQGNNIDTFRLYQVPYLAYLPYSLVNYLGIVLPLLAVCLRGAREDFGRSSRAVREVELSLKHWPPNLDDCEHLIRKSALEVEQALARFSWIIFLLGVAVLVEQLGAFETLALKAQIYAVVAYLVVIGGAIALFPSVIGLEQAIRDFKFRLHDLHTVPPEELDRRLKRLDSHTLGSILFSDRIAGARLVAGLLAPILIEIAKRAL